ncbi:hypothetical protein [Demequina maris]|uniref:hypothetical protein n=1 Tax=Demequina maris TaxID=1638982 RepID=UPI000785AB4E|nr:hypothetical protein [Demequina maris]
MSKGHRKRDKLGEAFAAADLANPIVDLPTGVRGCGRCGIAVRMATDPPTITVTALSVTGPMALTTAGQRFSREFILPLCGPCAERRDRAATWSDDSALRAAWGSPDIVIMRTWATLDAFAVLDQPEPTTAHDVWRAHAHLGAAGAAAQWALRYAPTLAKGATVEQGTLNPWGHVDEPLREEARDGYAALLAARIDAPVEHPCPGGGCLYCGVDHVVAMRSADPWTPHTLTTSSIGGGQGSRAGFLCPTCEAAYQHEGANGMTALTRALCDALGFREGRQGYPEATGLTAWCARKRAPSDTPFGWLPNLDALREEHGTESPSSPRR